MTSKGQGNRWDLKGGDATAIGSVPSDWPPVCANSGDSAVEGGLNRNSDPRRWELTSKGQAQQCPLLVGYVAAISLVPDVQPPVRAISGNTPEKSLLAAFPLKRERVVCYPVYMIV